MNSRMDKYEYETPELKKRTDRNKDLYYSNENLEYDKFDVNSNVSILQNNARSIDIDQIRDMLDKKYRDNLPQRKSIDIPQIQDTYEKDPLEDTKEYDLNSILNKVKDERIVDYDKERLIKRQSSEELINKINEKYGNKKEDDDELSELIQTITSLELKNSKKDDAELLGLSDDSDDKTFTKTSTSIIPEKPEDFYTGTLAVSEDDFEDFKDMQNDIKSNSVFIKILAIIFIVILIGAIVFVANNLLDLGLF